MNSTLSARLTLEELENSFPMDLGRRFRRPEDCEFLSAIIADIRSNEKKRGRARTRHNEIRWLATIEALLANLVAGHLNVIDPERFVAVSFNKNTYNGTDISITALRQCRDYLSGKGYITLARGYRRLDRSGVDYFGRRTRIRATDLLRHSMDISGVNRRTLTRTVSAIIQIKKPIDGLGGIPKDVEASRAVIEALNIRLADTDIRIPDTLARVLEKAPAENEGETPEDLYRKQDYAGDFTATSLYRAFKFDWRSGGRIYGGWWMSLKKVVRPYLMIDGSPVVELDYKALHPSLLYLRANADLPHDPYVVGNWTSQNMRNLGKRTFNRLLNRQEADPDKRLKIQAAPGDKDLLVGKLSFQEYLPQFIDGLRPIHPWFGTGEGIRLQYRDSIIALHVLSAMEAKGIVVLPIHDSFIVAEDNERQLREAMESAFEGDGFIPQITRTPPRSME